MCNPCESNGATDAHAEEEIFEITDDDEDEDSDELPEAFARKPLSNFRAATKAERKRPASADNTPTRSSKRPARCAGKQQRISDMCEPAKPWWDPLETPGEGLCKRNLPGLGRGAGLKQMSSMRAIHQLAYLAQGISARNKHVFDPLMNDLLMHGVSSMVLDRIAECTSDLETFVEQNKRDIIKPFPRFKRKGTGPRLIDVQDNDNVSFHMDVPQNVGECITDGSDNGTELQEDFDAAEDKPADADDVMHIDPPSGSESSQQPDKKNRRLRTTRSHDVATVSSDDDDFTIKPVDSIRCKRRNLGPKPVRKVRKTASMCQLVDDMTEPAAARAHAVGTKQKAGKGKRKLKRDESESDSDFVPEDDHTSGRTSPKIPTRKRRRRSVVSTTYTPLRHPSPPSSPIVSTTMAVCPICQEEFSEDVIRQHSNECADKLG